MKFMFCRGYLSDDMLKIVVPLQNWNTFKTVYITMFSANSSVIELKLPLVAVGQNGFN